MAKKSWLKIIGGLKRLIRDNGQLWPNSTKLAGFDSDGPYYCGMCEYLKRDKEGKPVLDESGFGRCNQPVMLVDKEVEHDKSGLAIIQDVPKGCCEWVERFKKGEK